MQNFNQIIDTLKTITSATTDKAIAIELHIKPTTYASIKRRQRIPYKAILGYCRAHRTDPDRVLLGKSVDLPVEEGKVLVRYFRSLEEYGRFLGLAAEE